MGQYKYLGSALRQSTHARAHALVKWLSVRLDLYVRPCARSWGCGSGISLTCIVPNTPRAMAPTDVFPY
jgi:hypothetical protein